MLTTYTAIPIDEPDAPTDAAAIELQAACVAEAGALALAFGLAPCVLVDEDEHASHLMSVDGALERIVEHLEALTS